jgi:hypothetical protein
MAISYYDDAIVEKLKKWIPDTNRMRVLGPDDTKKLFETKADDSNDSPVKFPFITLSRNRDLEILSTIKQLKSFDGLKIMDSEKKNFVIPEKTALFNAIPVKTTYQINIYTKFKYEADEYVRNFLFKLINNPQIVVSIPYNDMDLRHTANLRVLDTVSDTSDISQRIFPGQFYRWTIQLELQDGFLFNIPYKTNYFIGQLDVTLANDPQPDDLIYSSDFTKEAQVNTNE